MKGGRLSCLSPPGLENIYIEMALCYTFVERKEIRSNEGHLYYISTGYSGVMIARINALATHVIGA